MGEYSSNENYTGTKRREKDKHCLRQKGQAVKKHCDILDATHKVARYIDGSLLHSQNGCQICSTGVDKVPGWTQVHISFLRLLVYYEILNTLLRSMNYNFNLTSSVKIHRCCMQECIYLFYLLFYYYMPVYAYICNQIYTICMIHKIL